MKFAISLQISVFIDLSKAFDTINHEILLKTLQYYGKNGVALNWFKDYLSERQQFVNYNGYLSSFRQVKCGVPQGSVHGSLLFLIYVNDICNVWTSSSLDIILFADDTSILNNELNKLTEWFSANKLSVNIKKSKYTVFV